ncbi:MAG TPA: DUF1186 domain-containing protein [Parachlamydiaceae bacterium]|nr:DUF1186 domain-containing protein [Parachlamydiaceae bacterium]
MKNLSVEDIINKFRIGFTEHPQDELQAASELENELTPHLLEDLEFALNNPGMISHLYMGHIFALYLLAEYRRKDAFPYLLKFLYMPQDSLDELFGDTYLIDFDRIIASVFNGEIKPLLDVFEDKKICDHSRFLAFNSVMILMNQGLIEKDMILSYIEDQLVAALENKNEWLVTTLVDSIMNYRLERFYPLAYKAFDISLVDRCMLTLNDFKLKVSSVENLLDSSNIFMRKASEELAYFGEAPTTFSSNLKSIQETFKAEALKKSIPDRKLQKIVPFLPSNKICRNDPCKCGSGKKFKKCCLVK